MNPVEIIQNSCYIPYLKSIFYGNNILELLKNTSQFEALLNSLRIMTKNLHHLFHIRDGDNEKTLYEIFSEINSDCEIYLNSTKDDDQCQR